MNIDEEFNDLPRCKNGGKVCFHKIDAITKANWLKKRGNANTLVAYHCPSCNYWHLSKRDNGRFKKYES